MKILGEKIKQLRTEKNYSQDSLWPDHQSFISQIEKGDIKVPSENTLRIISKALDITFDELIDGTEWTSGLSNKKKNEYAFSQMDCSVRLEKTGEFKIFMKSYSMYNEDGEENKYCPETGTELITECGKCKRGIEQPDQQFCMGCGCLIYDTHTQFKIINNNFSHDLRSNKKEQARVESWIAGRKKTESKIFNDYTDIDILENIFGWDTYEGTQVPGWAREFTTEEMYQGYNSKILEIRNWWYRHYRELSFFKSMLYELIKYEIEIMKEGKIDLKEVPIQENESETKVEEKESDLSQENGSEDKKENKTEEEE